MLESKIKHNFGDEAIFNEIVEDYKEIVTAYSKSALKSRMRYISKKNGYVPLFDSRVSKNFNKWTLILHYPSDSKELDYMAMVCKVSLGNGNKERYYYVIRDPEENYCSVVVFTDHCIQRMIERNDAIREYVSKCGNIKRMLLYVFGTLNDTGYPCLPVNDTELFEKENYLHMENGFIMKVDFGAFIAVEDEYFITMETFYSDDILMNNSKNKDRYLYLCRLMETPNLDVDKLPNGERYQCNIKKDVENGIIKESDIYIYHVFSFRYDVKDYLKKEYVPYITVPDHLIQIEKKHVKNFFTFLEWLLVNRLIEEKYRELIPIYGTHVNDMQIREITICMIKTYKWIIEYSFLEWFSAHKDELAEFYKMYKYDKLIVLREGKTRSRLKCLLSNLNLENFKEQFYKDYEEYTSETNIRLPIFSLIIDK